jgi:iron(III) transport system substrate-binding protein
MSAKFLKKYLVCLPLATAALIPAEASADKKQVWVYTSIYKEYAGPIENAFESKNPDIDVQVFQAGSEKIQAKVEAELMAQKPQADIILTSDPFWSEDLIKRGLAQPRGKSQGADTNYYSVMVLICQTSLPKEQCPASFKDLTKPEFKDQIQMGSPLESGTMFSTVAYLSKKYGWDYFKKLKENGLSATGGNSAVIQKLESGEKKVGVVLLENALAAKKRASPIEIVYPADGSIPIPSVQVILKDSDEKDAAAKFADFILSQEGQNILRGGYMYSVRSDVAAPEGAKSFKEITKNSTPWTKARLQEVAKESKEIKKQFSQIVLQ